eukprot:236636_1
MSLQSGDWICPNCAFIIWAHKPACIKCGARNPKFRKRTICSHAKDVNKYEQFNGYYSCIHCMKLLKTKRLSRESISSSYSNGNNTVRLITNITNNDGSSKYLNSRKRKHSDLKLKNDTTNDNKKQRISASVILDLLSSDDDNNNNNNNNNN